MWNPFSFSDSTLLVPQISLFPATPWSPWSVSLPASHFQLSSPSLPSRGPHPLSPNAPGLHSNISSPNSSLSLEPILSHLVISSEYLSYARIQQVPNETILCSLTCPSSRISLFCLAVTTMHNSPAQKPGNQFQLLLLPRLLYLLLSCPVM